MLNWLLRARRAKGDVNAVRRGPKAVGKRAGGRVAHKLVSRIFR
ncbi:hypothetical protein HDA30_001120 [Micrococcus cohnii]|uniref:Uncharacterized protein n=1 Tax=Micrococcus cohnii TaxID=993416 RepID=A0A7W7GP03_9MICC|nr:hypothetical protein [Micrococcus cohnii]MBB4735612.1 hypothetical protein [Micrococcus cohnii]